ncbi:hypothetical protein ACFVYP_16115 [Kitasatospora sp. NPDC058201]|uniref:hypothetical protein n=1 Tax=unclassified Kitasatospora TaxID=2633591 RepID=UPI00365D94D9
MTRRALTPKAEWAKRDPAQPFPKRRRASSGSPLTDYLEAKRSPTPVAPGEALQRDAILAHCECVTCVSRRSV